MAGLTRRGLLGHVGTAAAGAAAGTALGIAVSEGRGEPPGDAAPVSTRQGETLSPWGRHQPGIAAHPAASTQVVALDLHSAMARDRDGLARMLRVLTGDIESLAQGRGAPGDPTPWLAGAAADVTITVGLGPDVLQRFDLESPPGWIDLPPMRHDRLQPRWCGGDVMLLVTGRDATTSGHAVRRLVADLAPFADLRWRQVGSWNGWGGKGEPVTGRNWFGQVDGSGNPRPGTDLFDETVWIQRGPWAGGTTLVVRRIRMDTATWDELTREERSVGRRLEDGAPLTGGAEHDDVDLAAREGGRWAVARDAHVRRSHPSLNGGARIFRKGVNYEDADSGEVGLVFVSAQADLGGQFVPIQTALDHSDALNEWTTAIGSAQFVVLPGFAEGEWLGQSLVG